MSRKGMVLKMNKGKLLFMIGVIFLILGFSVALRYTYSGAVNQEIRMCLNSENQCECINKTESIFFITSSIASNNLDKAKDLYCDKLTLDNILNNTGNE
jgi:hypothetical protein